MTLFAFLLLIMALPVLVMLSFLAVIVIVMFFGALYQLISSIFE